MYGFGLKVDGVALGTLIAQYAGFLTALFLLMRHYRRLMRQLSGMSAEDRDAIDAYFAKYRKNKDAQLTYK